MYGGPSHIDTFDYKPTMVGMDGKTVDVKTFGRGGHKNQGRIVEPRWKFHQYGQCGKWVSELFPHLAECVDDIAFLHSMTAESPIHGSAMLMMNSGRLLSGSPALGSWVNYGLGSVNENLPGFVVMLDRTGGPISGAKNWSSGYMPATLRRHGVSRRGLADQRPVAARGHDATRCSATCSIRSAGMNERHRAARPDNTDLAARIATYELAFKMQQHAPGGGGPQPGNAGDARSVRAGPRADARLRHALPAGPPAGRARRAVHPGLFRRRAQRRQLGRPRRPRRQPHQARRRDRPADRRRCCKDLKQRGLLDETLVVWGGEFGRQPTAEYDVGTGRDHNSYGFTMWMAGGGIKGGVSVGTTDELGSTAVDKPLHVKRLHATVLQQMGLDPNGLSYFFRGLDQKLVGVEPVEPIHRNHRLRTIRMDDQRTLATGRPRRPGDRQHARPGQGDCALELATPRGAAWR